MGWATLGDGSAQLRADPSPLYYLQQRKARVSTVRLAGQVARLTGTNRLSCLWLSSALYRGPCRLVVTPRVMRSVVAGTYTEPLGY